MRRLVQLALPCILACQALPALGAGRIALRGEAALALIQSFDPGLAVPVPPPPGPGQAADPEARTREFEDALVALIDELSVKDPVLLSRIRTEEIRIRALPSRSAQAAALGEAYPRLEQALDKSAAQGKLSPEGAATWKVFRAQTQEAIANGTLFERAQFAGQAFDDTVQGLLSRGQTILDPARKLPETKNAYLAIARRIHDRLRIPGNSTRLTPKQIDQAFRLAGGEFGIRPEFLKYMAKTESGLRQSVPSNPAASGIMQVERVHTQAYAGARNVENDTITNIVYGALLRAKTDRAMAQRFTEAGIAPPSHARIVEFLGDLAYNRGPELLRFVARHAAEQMIDVNEFGEYLGGPGGSYALLDDGKRIVVRPGPGTNIDETGRNSVLELSSEDVGRVQFSRRLTEGLGDRNGDGRVDHMDVWLTRGVRYLSDPAL
ncbi:MAG TPA: hypothetical protein DD417_07115 [Elusimicrobia bacterium]|nr:hypothetical protein [Elusimicrobiota bacterium]